MHLAEWLGWLLVFGGGGIAALNFYLSFLRYRVWVFLSRQREDYRWVSGVPLVGSATLVLGLGLLEWSTANLPPPVVTGALVLAVLDTGGIHWAVSTLIWHYVRDRFRPAG